jgi:hypothetical protein
VTAQVRAMTESQRERIIGLIEPTQGRFWLIAGSTIYVFSYFPASKVSAWTTYDTEFDVTGAAVFGGNVFLRGADKVYAYGGTGAAPVYDGCLARARTPFLDAGSPSRAKTWQGFDVAAEGAWRVGLHFDPGTPDTTEAPVAIFGSTHRHGSLPVSGRSTHASITFETTHEGPAKVGSLVLQFEGDDDAR